MKKNITKTYFTLLEFMVTIILLSICFSLIGLNIKNALYSHKYKSNMKKIDSNFQFCKKMAFSNQADVYLTFFQQNENLFCEMGTAENVGFFENTKKMKEIFENINFLFNEKKLQKIEITFSSSGDIFPKGIFEFSDRKHKLKKQIRRI